MSLKVYHDLMSQPSRALILFLEANKIPFEDCAVALRKGQHLTDEYAKNVHRFHKVPAIDDNGFKLIESVAILRYLCREKKNFVANHWYPVESREQAKVDEYLEWQHGNTRAYCAMFFRMKVVIPLLTGEPPKEDRVQTFKKGMEEALDNIENVWLGSRNKFLVGDQITIADLLGACEVEQPAAAGYDTRKGRPILSAWLERVRSETNPHYDEVHSIIKKFAAKFPS